MALIPGYGKIIHYDDVPMAVQHVGFRKWRLVTETQVSTQVYHSEEEAWWAYTFDDVEWEAKGDG